MPYERTPELLGFQRWVIGAYNKVGNKNSVAWADWEAADYEPRNLGYTDSEQLFLEATDEREQ